MSLWIVAACVMFGLAFGFMIYSATRWRFAAIVLSGLLFPIFSPRIFSLNWKFFAQIVLVMTGAAISAHWLWSKDQKPRAQQD
ncbi:MAG TPA: hypothetical protein VEA59_07365 [Patescibacteria group bacterium]|nr:hypothetical protein [Patescibacteria group bacterium]